jgi:hypothetical protein
LRFKNSSLAAWYHHEKTAISLAIATSTLLFTSAALEQTMAAKDNQLYRAFGEKLAWLP